jgi:predicted metal-dependent peptidase
MERAVKEFAEAAKAAAAQGRGSVPAGILRLANDLLKPPKVPWRKKLGTVARRAVAWAAGAVDHRYDAPSRRQAGIGHGPGLPVLSRLRQRVPRVALVIDTSGSMGDAELSRAVSETIGVVKAVGAAVQLYSCDAAVHAAAPVKSLADVARNLKGGGGTLFQPVFDALEKAQPKPDVLVFVTDGGCFDAPKQPRGVKVVWVLVGKHRCRPNGVDWGDFVEVDED